MEGLKPQSGFRLFLLAESLFEFLAIYSRSREFIRVPGNLFAFPGLYSRSWEFIRVPEVLFAFLKIYPRSTFSHTAAIKKSRSTRCGIFLFTPVRIIRTERFHFTADSGQFLERAAHHRGVFVFKHVDDEEIIADARFQRARFDFA
jgi:hypothetical protein